MERLESLLRSVRALNRQAYEAIQRELTPELMDLVSYEAQYQAQLLRTVLPAQVVVRVGVATVVPEQVYAAALARPLQGVLLRSALDGLEEGRARLIRQTLARGYVEGRTIAEMVRELRGTRSNGYADGLFERGRRDVETIVRTAISHYAGFTRDRFYAANSDIIVAQVWLSTMDSRTSEPCILRDSRKYTVEANPKPIGHAYPWGQGPGRYHWNCRSVSTPITKSLRELGVDAEDMDAGTRASLDGQIPAATTYSDWLSRQSASRQDQILGPTRGKLMRDGGLTVERFATDKGRWLSLDELRERDAAAFARAGL